MSNSSDKNGPEKGGYGKPPKKHQFKQGQSGNPRGRPRGSKNKLGGNAATLAKIIKRESERTIMVQDGGKDVPMSLAKTIVRSLGIKAAKGDPQSIRQFLNMLKTIDDEQKVETYTAIKNAMEYKRITEEYIENRKYIGDDFKMPLPHPDHIIIDWETLEITINGPSDKKTLKHWKSNINLMASMEVELEMVSNEPREENIDDLSSEVQESYFKHEQEEYEFTRKWLRKFRKNIPVDDPLWLEYGPGYKREWIDCYYFYGPSPRNSLDEMPSLEIDDFNGIEGLPVTHVDRETVKTLLKEREVFRCFMRKYLEWSMESQWAHRFQTESLMRPDIELDGNIYEVLVDCFGLEDLEDEEKKFEMFQSLQHYHLNEGESV